MTDKVDPIEILLEKRIEIQRSIEATKTQIGGLKARVKEAEVNLATSTAQLVVIDAALTKLGHLIEEPKK